MIRLPAHAALLAIDAAELVHERSLADLSGEYATIVTAADLTRA
ncbi:MAG TPA: hypothetical protein VKZ87_11485 [Ferrovibrio sp.]|nr:hypothetical protein [Ferrovibrio sp.]HLT78002.1 hypothetical protein [Ferrovibrio sp.]